MRTHTIPPRLPPSGTRRLMLGAGLGLVALQSGCTVTLPPGAAGPERPAVASAGNEGVEPSLQSVALSVDGYKRDVAAHIYRRCPELLFEGAPPAILRSVVVLGLSIDANGRPASVSVVRSNGYTELERAAVGSVRRAAPLPQPSRLIARNGRVDFYETWLFRDDGRFQIRSLAEVQRSELG